QHRGQGERERSAPGGRQPHGDRPEHYVRLHRRWQEARADAEGDGHVASRLPRAVRGLRRQAAEGGSILRAPRHREDADRASAGQRVQQER
ncbi:unnamed protein product, partial [Ectocarpus sp. 12 AP-2014]